MAQLKRFWVVEVSDEEEFEAELNKARPGYELHSFSTCYAPNAVYYTMIFKAVV